MTHPTTAWRRWTWFAWLAIFGLVCAPSVSAALSAAGAGAGDWVEVCSAQGTRVQALAGASDEAPSSALPGAEHCPLCGVASHLMPGPATDAAWPWRPLAHGMPPLAARRPGLPPEPRAPSQPRAPPVAA